MPSWPTNPWPCSSLIARALPGLQLPLPAETLLLLLCLKANLSSSWETLAQPRPLRLPPLLWSPSDACVSVRRVSSVEQGRGASGPDTRTAARTGTQAGPLLWWGVERGSLTDALGLGPGGCNLLLLPGVGNDRLSLSCWEKGVPTRTGDSPHPVPTPSRENGLSPRLSLPSGASPPASSLPVGANVLPVGREGGVSRSPQSCARHTAAVSFGFSTRDKYNYFLNTAF